MRHWWLLAVFVVANAALLAFSILGDNGTGNQYLLLEMASAIFLLQSPAIVWRILGASADRVLVTAIVLPLLVFEPWLAVEAIRNAHVGGDLQGIEQFLMWFIVGPVAIMACFVCVASTLLIRADRQTPDT